MNNDNIKLVQDYEEVAFNKKDIEEAAAFLSEDFKQHNPNFADGVEGFKAGMKWLTGEYPNLKVEIKDIFSVDDKVIIHVWGDMDTTNPDSDKKAIMDIFRIEDGKIAEHWDVIQDIPKEVKNSNTMF